jgi:hypothetical protein
MSSSTFHKPFLFFAQARPVDCAKQMPGGAGGDKLHCESICRGLRFAWTYLMYVRRQLEDDMAGTWDKDTQDNVSKFLMAGLFFLASALDGFVILDRKQVDSNMSFVRTPLNNPEALPLQEEIKALRSSASRNTIMYADFWTLWDFMKHYNAHSWMPKVFTVSTRGGDSQSFYDIFVPFTDGSVVEESGPLFRDIVLPCYNKAVRICLMYAKCLGLTTTQFPEEIMDLL